MKPFPEPHELISFFSQEPELMYADTPSFYNTLRFDGRIAEVSYVVTISPSDRELRLQIQSEQMSVGLAVTEVAGLTVHEGPLLTNTKAREVSARALLLCAGTPS